MAIAEWYEDHENLCALWRWLEDRGQAPSDVAGYLEKPWHWEPEWNQMRKDQARPEVAA